MENNTFDIKSIPSLSMLTIRDEEADSCKADVEILIRLASGMASTDISQSEIKQRASSLDSLRADTPNDRYKRDDMLKNAHSSKDGYIFIPTVTVKGGDES